MVPTMMAGAKPQPSGLCLTRKRYCPLFSFDSVASASVSDVEMSAPKPGVLCSHLTGFPVPSWLPDLPTPFGPS